MKYELLDAKSIYVASESTHSGTVILHSMKCCPPVFTKAADGVLKPNIYKYTCENGYLLIVLIVGLH